MSESVSNKFTVVLNAIAITLAMAILSGQVSLPFISANQLPSILKVR